jgi:hypothetical protein
MGVPTVQCTACGTKLRVAAAVPPGKRVRCPKCSVIFIVADPEIEPSPGKSEGPVPQSSRSPRGSSDPQSPHPPFSEQLRRGNPDEPKLPKPGRKRRKKSKEDLQKAAIKRRLMIALPIVTVLMLGMGLIVFAFSRGPARKKRNDNNELVTEANFQKLKPGFSLAETETVLGDAYEVPLEEVADAWADGASASYHMSGMARPGMGINRKGIHDDIEGMAKQFTIIRWVRWRNKTANIFAGLRTGDDGAPQVAVFGYLDFDAEAKNYSAQWKLLPVSIEISNTGSRMSIGKPLPVGSATNIDKVRRGMAESEVHDLLGLPGYVEDLPTTAAAPRARKMSRYYDDKSHCLPPPAFAASTAALAAAPSGAGPLLVLLSLNTRSAAYEIDFEEGRVVGVRFLRLP